MSVSIEGNVCGSRKCLDRVVWNKIENGSLDLSMLFESFRIDCTCQYQCRIQKVFWWSPVERLRLVISRSRKILRKSMLIEMVEALTGRRGLLTIRDFNTPKLMAWEWLSSAIRPNRLVVLWPLICTIPRLRDWIVTRSSFTVSDEHPITIRMMCLYGLHHGNDTSPDMV